MISKEKIVAYYCYLFDECERALKNGDDVEYQAAFQRLAAIDNILEQNDIPKEYQRQFKID